MIRIKALLVRTVIAAVGLVAAVSACLQAPASETRLAPAHPVSPLDVDTEAARLRVLLNWEVPNLIVDAPKAGQRWISRTLAAIAASDLTISRPQLLVVVDRNPHLQQMRIVMARTEGPWKDLGGTKVSTGQMGRRDYYVTPTGVFCTRLRYWTGGRRAPTTNSIFAVSVSKGCGCGISAGSARRRAGARERKARSACCCMRPTRLISSNASAMPLPRDASAFPMTWTGFSIGMECSTPTTSAPQKMTRVSQLFCFPIGHRRRLPEMRSSSSILRRPSRLRSKNPIQPIRVSRRP